VRGRPVRVMLVGGHESADGADLLRFEDATEDVVSARPGRGFHTMVADALAAGETVVVVPMTFGRNPTMVADTAKTLSWLAADRPGRLALAAPFGQLDHLTAWLRTAANRVRSRDAEAALLIVAAPSNPFDEAEVHRVAYLVATHGALDEVGAGIAADSAGLAGAVDRLRRLGAEHVVMVPAGFAARLPAADAEDGGPLMSDAAVARVVGTRVRDALAALDDGHDGIGEGLMADHGHGYAHSHAFDESGGAAHSHGHGHHGHSHPVPHDHADGTTHAHAHEGPHAHLGDDLTAGRTPAPHHH
jgi:sirohydrochlorin cobaltochelatase